MAKFDYLYSNNGMGNGEQIVSTDWVIKSTQTYNLLEENSGYGYQWWTFPQINVYYASSLYGQSIFIAPKNDLVVVFTAEISSNLVIHDLFNSILSAIK